MRVLCKFLLLVLLFAAHADPGHAQPPACTGTNVLDELRENDEAAHTRVTAAAKRTENANAIMWRIDKDGTPPSHLFATMHISDERINALSPAVMQALADSRRLVLELDDLSPDNFMTVFSGSRQMVGLMLFTDGRRLDQLLDSEDFRKVTEILSRSGIPPGIGGMFRPWLATLLLSVPLCEQRRTAAGLLPLDAKLAKDAEARGVKLEGLETLESQLRALAAVPEPDQVEMLKASVRFYHRIDDMMETMIQLYLRRELGAIWPLQKVLAEKSGVRASAFDSAEQRLLIQRNIAMRDRIVEILDEGGEAFIAVGGLHLPGKGGLVALIREAGYSVTAVD